MPLIRMSQNDVDTIRQAAQALRDALTASGYNATDQAVVWMLGQTWGESRFGTTPDWTIPNALNTAATNPGAPAGPSYNWGAVRASPGAPFILHYDRDAAGELDVYKFARFDSHESSARHYLGALLRLDVSDAVALVLADEESTSLDMARAMYTRNPDPSVTKRSQLAYYTGVSGSDEDRIAAYGRMIDVGAQHILALVPDLLPPSADDTQPYGCEDREDS